MFKLRTLLVVAGTIGAKMRRRVIRSNKWHSIELTVRKVHPDDGGGKEIRLAADQRERWNATYLTPNAARKLAELLDLAADEVDNA